MPIFPCGTHQLPWFLISLRPPPPSNSAFSEPFPSVPCTPSRENGTNRKKTTFFSRPEYHLLPPLSILIPLTIIPLAIPPGTAPADSCRLLKHRPAVRCPKQPSSPPVQVRTRKESAPPI